MRIIMLILALSVLIACEEQPGSVQQKGSGGAVVDQFPAEQDLANYLTYVQQKARYELLHSQFSPDQITYIFQSMQIVYIPTYSADDMCEFLWHKPKIQNFSYGAGQFYSYCMWSQAFRETLTQEQFDYLANLYGGI